MARVAFFNESLPDGQNIISQISYQLIRSLGKNQHQIKVLTSFEPLQKCEFDATNVDLIFPFKNWRPWELPKIIGPLSQFRPEIFHVIQPHRKKFNQTLHSIKGIPFIQSLLQSPPLVLSIYDLDSEVFNFKSYRDLIHMSQLILVPNQSLKNQISSVLGARTKQRVEVLPIDVAYFDQEEESSWVSETEKPYFILPGTMDNRLNDLMDLLNGLKGSLRNEENWMFYFIDGWGELDIFQRKKIEKQLNDLGLTKHVHICSQLNPHQKNLIEKNAQGMIVQGLSPVGLELSYWLQRCLWHKLPVLMGHLQADFDSIQWRNWPHCFVLDDLNKGLPKTLDLWKKSPDFKDHIQNKMNLEHRRSLFDAPSNWVSRLYQDLLIPIP